MVASSYRSCLWLLFFHTLLLSKTNDLSLGFRVGKFRNSGPLDIVCDFYIFHIFLASKTNNLSLRFSVGNFCDSGPLDIVYGLYFFLFLKIRV